MAENRADTPHGIPLERVRPIKYAERNNWLQYSPTHAHRRMETSVHTNSQGEQALACPSRRISVAWGEGMRSGAERAGRPPILRLLPFAVRQVL